MVTRGLLKRLNTVKEVITHAVNTAAKVRLRATRMRSLLTFCDSHSRGGSASVTRLKEPSTGGIRVRKPTEERPRHTEVHARDFDEFEASRGAGTL